MNGEDTESTLTCKYIIKNIKKKCQYIIHVIIVPLIAILDDGVKVKEAALIKFLSQSLWCAFNATWMHVHGILAKVTRCKEIVNEIVFSKKLFSFCSEVMSYYISDFLWW